MALHDILIRLWPSPVVALDRAVAVGFAQGGAAGLAVLDALSGEPQLAGYGYLPRGGRRAPAGRAAGRGPATYEEALLLTDNAVERAFLTGRLHASGTSP